MAEDVVRTKRLELVDDDGRVRARLGLSDESAPDNADVALNIYDKEGANRAAFGLAGDGAAALSLHDGQQNQRAALAVGGSHGDQPRLMLYDALGRNRADIGLLDTGAAHVTLYDEWGQTRVTLVVGQVHSAANHLAGLVLFDSNGNAVKTFGTAE